MKVKQIGWNKSGGSREKGSAENCTPGGEWQGEGVLEKKKGEKRVIGGPVVSFQQE